MKAQIILLSLSTSLLLVACGGEAKKDDSEKVLLPNVKTSKVVQNDFKHWVELQGSIESPQDVMLTPEVGGTIRSINVREGQTVKKGQLIAFMDNSIIGSNISEAITAAENAAYNYGKEKELFDAGVSNEFKVRQSGDQLKLADKRVRSLKTQAGKAAIYAPFNGVIDEIYPSEGEVSGPGMPICHIIGLEKVTVTAGLSESYINKVKEGTKIKVIIPSLDTVIQDVEINRISRYINPTNRTFQVFIDLDNTSQRIVPNMIARVQINDQSYSHATQVADGAIQYDKNGKTFLYMLKSLTDSTYISNKVDIERQSAYAGNTVISHTESLSAGDLIVTDGAEGIQDKDTVRILK